MSLFYLIFKSFLDFIVLCLLVLINPLLFQQLINQENGLAGSLLLAPLVPRSFLFHWDFPEGYFPETACISAILKSVPEFIALHKNSASDLPNLPLYSCWDSGCAGSRTHPHEALGDPWR